jgi:hypothetical protein
MLSLMKLFLRLATAACFALIAATATPFDHPAAARSGFFPAARDGGDARIEDAFANRVSGQQVAGQGTVAKVLRDDGNGSRHQRFIVRLDSGRTLLVAHNIDLAPRVAGLRAGDRVVFYGEYEWNPKGGVLHWTHRDPRGRHPAGWIRHDGRLYQ